MEQNTLTKEQIIQQILDDPDIDWVLSDGLTGISVKIPGESSQPISAYTNAELVKKAIMGMRNSIQFISKDFSLNGLFDVKDLLCDRIVPVMEDATSMHILKTVLKNQLALVSLINHLRVVDFENGQPQEIVSDFETTRIQFTHNTKPLVVLFQIIFDHITDLTTDDSFLDAKIAMTGHSKYTDELKVTAKQLPLAVKEILLRVEKRA